MSAYAAVIGYIPYALALAAVLLVGGVCAYVRWIK